MHAGRLKECTPGREIVLLHVCTSIDKTAIQAKPLVVRSIQPNWQVHPRLPVSSIKGINAKCVTTRQALQFAIPMATSLHIGSPSL